MKRTVPRTGTAGPEGPRKRFDEAFVRELAKIGAGVRWSPLTKAQKASTVRAGFKPVPRRSESGVPFMSSKSVHSVPSEAQVQRTAQKMKRLPQIGPNPLLSKTGAENRRAGMSREEIEKARKRAKYASIAKRRKLQEMLGRLDRTSGSK
jgi:hypothetical protein